MHRLSNMQRAFGALAVLIFCGAVSVFAQLSGVKVEISSVVAVEQADSPYGAFRVVFDLVDPFPPATDSGPGIEFLLGAEKLRIPPGNDVGKRIFAYCDR